jgi:hypothetical protein
MKKLLLAICSILLISIAALVPGCNGTTGTIEVDATLDGSPWTGAVDYTLTPGTGSPVSGTSVDDTFTVDAGNWTCAYVSGGPGVFVSYTPEPPTQEVNAGDTVGFTLNFVTPTPMDASVTFKTWTHNGVPIPEEQTWILVYPDDWIDIEYEEHVSGEEDAHVKVHQTSWLEVHNIGWYGEEPGGATVNLHVVNAPGAVKMDPPAADKSNQQATVNGDPVEVCSLVPLPYCVKVKLDVEVDWELVVCNNYTKTINWIGFNPGGGEPMILQSASDVVFETWDDLYSGVTFTLTSKACLEPGEGFEDTNPSNDCTDWCPALNVTFIIPP